LARRVAERRSSRGAERARSDTPTKIPLTQRGFDLRSDLEHRTSRQNAASGRELGRTERHFGALGMIRGLLNRELLAIEYTELSRG
jgi:hypothetical protein